MNKLLLIVIAVATISILPAHVLADCQTVYGGGPNPSCTPSNGSLSVTKSVQRPGKGGDFTHNLGISDVHYGVSQTIPFQIVVKNTSSSTLNNVQVIDSLPQYMAYNSGNGQYDSSKNTVTNTIAKLDPGKSQTFIIVAKSVQESKLPQGQNTVCVTNTVKAQSGNTTSQDSSQVCIDKSSTAGATTTGTTPYPTQQVYPPQQIQKTPPTGPEDMVLPLLSATGLLGVFLRKKI